MSKKVVLFGASGDIGSAIEKLLISTDYEVISITKSQINFIEPLIENKISKLLNEINPDIVINSAGWFGNNTDPFEEIMSVNFGSNWSVVRHYMLLPKITKPVRIIMIGSICYNEGKKQYMVYAASKAALYSLWQGAKDYFLDSVLCIDLINPQRTKTKMTQGRIDPLLEYHDPNDVAEAILKLACRTTGSVCIDTQFKSNGDILPLPL